MFRALGGHLHGVGIVGTAVADRVNVFHIGGHSSNYGLLLSRCGGEGVSA